MLVRSKPVPSEPTQDNPLRAASWHSSQTGSQTDDRISETESKGRSEAASPAPPATQMEPAETPDPIPATQVTSPAPTPEPPVPDTQPEAKQPQEPAAPPKPIAPSTSPTQPEAKVLPKPAALSKPPSSAEAKTREPAQKKQAAKPEPEDDDEYRAPADEKPPPAPISKQTLMKRLARICSPKEDGTYKVPLEIIQSHKNLDTRDTVYRAFEKCGYDPVFPPRLSVSATITGGGGWGTGSVLCSCGARSCSQSE